MTENPNFDLFSNRPPDEEPREEPLVDTPLSGNVSGGEVADLSSLEGLEEGLEAIPGQRDEGRPKAWTVSELNRAVRGILEDGLPPLWVSGEVTNWTRARSGHCYFTIKDQNAQLRCVMWRSEAARLPTDPEEGMEVRAFGQVTLYEVRGEYQLSVRKLEAEGEEGLWRIAFEKLRKKLEAEGLLDPARKRPLPRFPACIGIVTSPTGAAIRDILTVVSRRAPWTRVILRAARVQGAGASEEIADALNFITASGMPDLVIVGRGGGSIEDLWAFNEEPLARSIAHSPVPVLSAVGHEIDVTISDLVADARAPTPSAAAELAVPDRREILLGLQEVPDRMASALRAGVSARRRVLSGALPDLRRRTMGVVSGRRLKVERLWKGLPSSIRLSLERRQRQVERHAGKLDALSPLSTLRRGYAVPLDSDGNLIRHSSDFVVGSRFVLRVVDGRIRCQVESVDMEGELRAGGEISA